MYALFSLLLFSSPQQIVGGGFEQLHQLDGLSAGDQFGISVSDAGDVNGDGFSDMIVGAHEADPGGFGGAGSAYVYSGADGSLLNQWDGAGFTDFFGFSVSGAGDVNGDGFADVIIGAHQANPAGQIYAGSAFVYSGVNGSLLYQWDGAAGFDHFGIAVSGAGDVNGDGFADLIVGAEGADPGGVDHAGSAYVYSGVNGSLLYQLNGAADGDYLGTSVSGAGDVNADGFADVIVGANTADPGGLSAAGSAYVYSGANGSLLYQWNGEDSADFFGFSVSDAGDVNGDGFADVIVGAELANSGLLAYAGSAFVYSGANGSLLFQWDGEATGDHFGYSVSGAGDVNGDGFADVIVGANRADSESFSDAGSAYLYSGADGSLIHRWDGEAVLDQVGISVSSAGDVDGDGFADVIVGANTADPGGIFSAGSSYVYSFNPFLQANTPTIFASTGGVLDLILNFPDTAASQDYITLMSVQGIGPITYGIDIPLSLDLYLRDSAAGVYPFSTTSNLQGTLSPSGNASASITFPAGAYTFAVGHTFWLAAISFPAGQLPAYSSVAVAIEIVP